MEDGFLNLSFMLASLATLLLVNRKSFLEDYDEVYEDEYEENEVPVDPAETEHQASVEKRMQIYSTLLVNMDKAKEAEFDRMPTFQEMMTSSSRRRCYSADDIDALGLIPDKRIKGVFDEALKELVSMSLEDKSISGISTVPSVDTINSWDKLN